MTAPQLPSDRQFGRFFASVFAALSVYGYWKEWRIAALLSLVVAVSFFVVTLWAAKSLGPLNRLWYEFGVLLHKIFSPFVLGIIFFVVLTPVAFITRLWGRDELKIKPRSVKSYWVDRVPPGPLPDSFKNQF